MKAKKHPGRGNKLRYPRIVWAAKELGVSRTHLTAVLNGERAGRPGLAENYKTLTEASETLPRVTRAAIAEAAGKLKGRGQE